MHMVFRMFGALDSKLVQKIILKDELERPTKPLSLKDPVELSTLGEFEVTHASYDNNKAGFDFLVNV